jgi:HPt (histidine-containing phosphotransfer) domain-containing protein
LSEADDAMAAVVARVWQRMRPTAVERIDHLLRVIGPWQTGTLSADHRAAALSDAHKLAGSLGTYGYLDGSALARQVEVLLSETTPLRPDVASRLAGQLQALRDDVAGH